MNNLKNYNNTGFLYPMLHASTDLKALALCEKSQIFTLRLHQLTTIMWIKTIRVDAVLNINTDMK